MRNCAFCGKPYEPKVHHQRYCSTVCGKAAQKARRTKAAALRDMDGWVKRGMR